MKSIAVGVGMALVLALPSLQAQGTPVPPGGRRIVGPGDAGGGAGATVVPTRPSISTTTVAKLGPVREWTNAAGKALTAELISWPITAPATDGTPAHESEIEVVQDGKIRLRVGEKTYEVALASLSQADQTYIRGIADQVAKDRTEREGEEGDVPAAPD